MIPQKERAGEATPARQAINETAPVKSMQATRAHRPDDDQEPDDPRAVDRIRAEQAEPAARDWTALAAIERAISRARLAWPLGPSPELRAWAQLSGPGRGGWDYLQLARARAIAAGGQLTGDELILAAAGLAFACPGLVAAHLRRAAHEGRAGRVA